METLNLLKVPATIDLAKIERDRRVHLWSRAASEISPGLSVQSFDSSRAIGSIQQLHLAAGALTAIRSAPAEVSYHPREVGRFDQFLTLVLEVEGSATLRQGQRRCELNQDDLCLVDENQPFRMTSEEASHLLLLRMPRAMVLSRFPGIEHLIGTLIPGEDPGTRLVTQTMRNLFDVARDLRGGQQKAALGAVVQLIGSIAGLSDECDTMHWRVHKALEFIQLNLSVPGLTAEQVAQDQRISRRRLDQLFLDACGQSVTSQIWARRLEHAAEDLRDPRWSGTSISQIAFANGFEDPAHFTRAFKRRFEATPGQWRLMAPAVAN